MSHDDTGPAPATRIQGATAAEIAASVRALIDRGALAPGEALPPVRTLAEQLGVNRNTAVAAYRQLAGSGLVAAHGRGGTRVAEPSAVASEGFSSATGVVDVGAGNPDPALIPDPSPVLARVVGGPVLYGAPVVDPALEDWARDWLAADLPVSADALRITVTSGAADALDRLFTALLAPGDPVAIEDPGFLTGIHTLRIGGYRPLAVPVDDDGMTPEGLQAAVDAGARAVICTPRAQNPSGASLSPERAARLREILAPHPYVLVVEDDHFSLLSRRRPETLIGPDHRRWALVRSVSKFLGPDMSLALVASDPHTAERLGIRLRPGTAWVSHLLQRLSLALLTDPAVRERIEDAGAHYAARNTAFRAALARHGLDAAPGEGLSLWVRVASPAHEVTERLRERGWLVRSGDEFRVSGDAAPASHRIRVTAHHLDDATQERLAEAIAAVS